MQIDNQIVERVAFLAKLNFEGDKQEAIKQDLNKILGMCEQLNQVDTAGVEPLVFLTPEQNALRPDKPEPGITKQEALKNAPEKDSDYFKVPKVFDR